MKCKLSKLFFLALIGVFSLKGYSQGKNNQGLKDIKEDYLAKKFEARYRASYEKALKFAKENNLPVEGVDKDGAYFSIKGIDETTGEISYFKTFNNTDENSSVQTARAQHLYNGGSLGINIQGQGMILGIWDGGHPQASHPNLGSSRITAKDSNVPTSAGQGGVDHATHVAGTMIGNGSLESDARGIAFEGFLWANNWDNHHAEMAIQAGQNLLVSNHSYGTGNAIYVNNPGVFGRYTLDSKEIDELTFANPNYLPVFAAGNDRDGIQGTAGIIPNPTKGGYDLMTHENVSKNAVVVGAIHGFTSYSDPSAVQMTSFSQWGPTDDFRIKPDITAKGYGVFSSNMPYEDSYNTYASYPGTSMAAPAVTAVFALWQQYFKELNVFEGIENMRASSLKALMAHTASEAGLPGPDPVFGWGVINAQGGAKILKDAFNEQGPSAVFYELELQNGQEYELDVTIDGSEEFNATIAWTDLAANVVSGTDSSTPLLINDLDLRVYLPGDDSLQDPAMPYYLVKNWSAFYSAKGDNDVDPIEKVNYFSDFDGFPEPGTYKIRVTHKGTLVGGSQKFTLVVSGGITAIGGASSTDNTEFEGLKIYPNPASHLLNISADISGVQGAKVVIYDMLGKKVYSNNSLFQFEGEALIDVSNFNTGVYLVEISNGVKVESRKVVIK